MGTHYPEQIKLDLPAASKYLNVLSAVIAEVLTRVEGLAQRESVTYSAQLAAHEACANIIDHAYAGAADQRIAIVVTVDDQPLRLSIDLYDTGRPFDLEQTPEPNLSVPQVRGYGLFIIRSLMDHVSYHPGPGRNHWCLVKHL